MDTNNIPVWELLQKQITWNQLSFIHNKKVLDFGSGIGITASYFASDNEVVAIEPDSKILSERITDNEYTQIHGDIQNLKKFEDESADYKIRKPHKDIFKIVFDDVRKYDASIKMEQVYFIGDNFEDDVLGADNFGFTPVFINRKQDTNINNKNFIEIKSLNELIKVIG